MKASTSATAIGNSVTLTASLTPATATGTVTFYSGSTAIGTADVNAGVATLNTAFVASGNVTLKAGFGGNSSWESSTSNQVSLFVTGSTPDTIELQVAPASLIIGYSATLTANVSPAGATGTVVFYDGTRAIDVATIGEGTATFVNTFRSAGSQSLTAVYSGDTTYLSNTSSAVALNVGNPGPTQTTTTLTLSEYAGFVGDTVTLTAIVNPPAATGQVDFYDNSTLLESVVVSSGSAAWSQSFTQAGQNTISAVYDGDVTYSSEYVQPAESSAHKPTHNSHLSDRSNTLLDSMSCRSDLWLLTQQCFGTREAKNKPTVVSVNDDPADIRPDSTRHNYLKSDPKKGWAEAHPLFSICNARRDQKWYATPSVGS